MANTKNAEAVEVIVTRKGMSLMATLYGPDETAVDLEVNTLSVRGAQRDVTASMIDGGYKPLGRWETLAEYGDDEEASRLFLRPRPEADK